MMRENTHGAFANLGSALAPIRGARLERDGGFFACKGAVYSCILIMLILLVSVLAPLLMPHGRDAMNLDSILAPPSVEHVLGTDDLGRDVFTRLVYAGRFSLLVALCSVAIALAIGVFLGAIAGYFGGAVDAAVAVVIDLFLSVPVFLVLLVAASAGGGRIWIVPLVIGGTSWMEAARVVRAIVLPLREEGFVAAARAAGARDVNIVVRHMLPQALPAVVVTATVGFAQAMLVESALSFLGFGVQPPVPTWGNMLQNAHAFIGRAPLAAIVPGFMIFITCLAFNNVGEGLRRALAIER